MKVFVCIDQNEWPGKEIPEISKQVERLLDGDPNRYLKGQKVSHEENTFRIIQDVQYPQADGRVLVLRCID